MKLFPWLSRSEHEALIARAVSEANDQAAKQAREMISTAVAEATAETRAQMVQQIMPALTQVAGNHTSYALDNPIWYTTPASPKRKAQQILSVDDCRRLADGFDVLRLPIQQLKREVAAQPIRVVARDAKDDSSATIKRINRASQFFATAGGNGAVGTPRQTFEKAWIEDLLVTGCFAINRTYSGGKLVEQSAIDAGTIRPRVDAFGWADDPYRYEQWIQGICVAQFREEDLYYGGLDPRSWTPYYISPIEWLFAPIMAGMAADSWNRTWLTDGNAPGDDIFTLPADLNPDQVRTYISIFDEILSGNTLERRKSRFLPSGSERLQIGSRRDMEFQEFEMWILRRVYAMFGVQPASAGFAGEQYKSSQEGSQESTTQFGAGAIQNIRKELYDDTLDRMGFGDLEVVDHADDEEDFATTASSVTALKAAGLISTNEARRRLGYEPVQGGDDLKPGEEEPSAVPAKDPAKEEKDNGKEESTGA
jgi:hypothetical protein